MKSEKAVAMGIVFALTVLMLVIFVGTASAALPIDSVMGTVEQKTDTKLEIHTEWKSGGFGGQGWNPFESTLEVPFEFSDPGINIWDEISVGDYVEVSGFHCWGEEQVCLANCLCIAKVKSSGDGLADKIISDIYGDPALLSWMWGDEPFKYDPPLLGNFVIKYDNKPGCPDCPPGGICEAEYTNIKISKDGNVLDTFSLYPNQNHVYEGEEHRIDVTFFSGATQCCLGGQVPSNFVIHIEENSPPKIVSAFWSLLKEEDQWQRDDLAEEGMDCFLVAIIENAEGKEVTFSIHECDSLWCYDKTPITTVKAPVEDDEAVATWVAKWMYDGPYEGDPEYRFEVIVDSLSADSENELRVSLHSTSEWEDMPVLDCQIITDDPNNIIKIDAPSFVSKGQEFEVNIEVSPEWPSTYKSVWIFLTQQDIKNTNLFMDKEGFKINQKKSKISVDYILGKSTNNPFALFDLVTAGKILAGKIIFSSSVAYSIGFDYIFTLLGYVTGTGGCPQDWALNIGETYLLGAADKTRRDIISLLELNEIEIDPAFILMRQKITFGERKNTMNYKLKLKAPYHNGVYNLALKADYSVLNYYHPNFLDHPLYKIPNTDALGSNLWEKYNLGYRFRLKEHTAYDFKTICVGNCKVFTTKCPVDMSIVDPEGLSINKRISEISGAVYTEQDINGDGDPDDRIIIPNPRIGDYEITVIPEPDAKSTDTYTLEVSSVDTTIAIAKNVPISEIPAEPYIFKSDKIATPILNDPGTTDTDGDYTVSWSSVSGATSYTLEEDTSISFSSPAVAYSGAGTSKYVTSKSDGTYYHRVKACNACGCSGWSNVEDITVEIETVITVDDSGGADYTTIQEAVDNAGSGYAIKVFSGNYSEHVVIDKSLKLIGENKDTTFIVGGGNGSCVHVTVDNVEISGFTIMSCFDGVYVESSKGIIIDNNIISDNFDGIYLVNSDSNIITHNVITNNIWYVCGIHLTSSSNNTISDNDIAGNDKGVYLYNSINNLIYHNNFINNTCQAYDNTGTNSWDNGYPSGGNYWNDYMGSDAYSGADQNVPSSDGIGDLPYSIDSDMDNYPLMQPWEKYFGVIAPTISNIKVSPTYALSGNSINISAGNDFHGRRDL